MDTDGISLGRCAEHESGPLLQSFRAVQVILGGFTTQSTAVLLSLEGYIVAMKVFSKSYAM